MGLIEVRRFPLNVGDIISWAGCGAEFKGEIRLSTSVHFCLLAPCGCHVASCLTSLPPCLPFCAQQYPLTVSTNHSCEGLYVSYFAIAMKKVIIGLLKLKNKLEKNWIPLKKLKLQLKQINECCLNLKWSFD